jgi:CubicO group peptidase (beta-lactamase class C family)
MASRRSLDRELQAAVDAARKRHKVPGTAVGVLLDGRETAVTSGVTSVDNPLAVTDRTLFMIGSTTKTFTATALMRLVEDGRLALDDLVTRHLEGFRLRSREATSALTLRHLLTHTGGWDGDVEPSGGWGEDALARYVHDLRRQPQETPVGTVWSYNNAGFAVLGRIIEVVTSLTFEAAVRQLVLDPAGMSDSFFLPTEVFSRRFAVGHASMKGGPVVAHTWGLDRSIGPAGGLVSTVRDQLRYAAVQLGGGTVPGGSRVLRRRTLEAMHRPQVPAGNFVDHMGLGWLLRDVDGTRIVAHGGNVSNLQVSAFLTVPARGFAVTVLTNSGTGGALSAEIERWVLERYIGIVQPRPDVLRLPGVDLHEYAGQYASKLSICDVEANGRGLRMSFRFNIKLEDYPEAERETLAQMLSNQPKSMRLGMLGPDRVVTLDSGRSARGEFLRPSPGAPVRWLRWGGRLMPRVG